MSKLFKKPIVNIKRDFYTMQSSDDGESADITMYGEIVEERPVDWWTGKPMEGNFIIREDFLKDLEKLQRSKSITLHIDSVGGDASVSFFIHNKLREMAQNGTKLSCIVDGVAMSGGSLIMCACDNVKVNPSSLIMIHKCWSFMFGGYNADDLRQMAETNDAYDKAQASVYMRKTGLSERVVLNMMSETTYMTGREAVEKGFADELTEETGTKIAASANGTSFFVKGRELRIAPGIFAPDFIPTVSADSTEESEEIEKNQTEVTVDEKGGNQMTKEELREQYPELVAELEADARTVEASDEAISNAVNSERQRIKEIDEIASLYSDDIVADAKYGNACTAQELAYRAAQEAVKNGKRFMEEIEEDAKDSNADEVTSSPEPIADETEDTPEAKKAKAKAAVSKLFNN